MINEVHEKHQHLESLLSSRRTRKWSIIFPASHKPTLSLAAVSLIQTELTRADNFNSSLANSFHPRPSCSLEIPPNKEAVTHRPNIFSNEVVTNHLSNILSDHVDSLSNIHSGQVHHLPVSVHPASDQVGQEEVSEEVSEDVDEHIVNSIPSIDDAHNLPGDTVRVSNNVFNLSSRILTQSEISILSKGLNFCPTPKSINRFQVKSDIVEFDRRLKCKFFFHNSRSNSDKNLANDRNHKFRKKSSWTPAVSEPAINLYLSELEKRLLAIDERGNNYSNLSQEERKALAILKNDQDIIIKQADKGSAVVVQDLSDYRVEAFRQLYDFAVYDSVDFDPIAEVASVIVDKVDVLLESEYIDEKCHEYLQVENPKLGTFYLLPKIHKSLMH